ncbi:MAG: sporulation initiation factor Spo0A C-terminal domain-containing protein [Bacillota bacterium]|nr:sporulation initiation factor Spo0A C-terminal domain-containing protein [Bacillota bacterium]
MDKPDKFQIEVYNALRELGIPAHVKGYEFLKTAMNYLRNNPNAIYSITKELYPEVAKMHGENVKSSHVERGIRTALGLSRANDDKWYSVMGKVGPMPNGEFLATLNESIKVKMAMEEVEKKNEQN